MTLQTITKKRSMSFEDFFCSKSRMKILLALKRLGQLDTSAVARQLRSSYGYADFHLRILEEQGVLTHTKFGKRSRIYRFNESPRARAVLELLAAWET
ncbi:winged helix-turn-helix domain-containing protein [Candidatus Bathyarchaeota archaeon]|nr:winged helix-turn-helix domain-containing protein [Candidatus Bathyarchaeota archaeon]